MNLLDRDIPNLDWHSDNVSYVVYSSGVKLLIPENANLRALELKVNEIYKLHQLSYEGIEQLLSIRIKKKVNR